MALLTEYSTRPLVEREECCRCDPSGCPRSRSNKLAFDCADASTGKFELTFGRKVFCSGYHSLQWPIELNLT